MVSIRRVDGSGGVSRRLRPDANIGCHDERHKRSERSANRFVRHDGFGPHGRRKLHGGEFVSSGNRVQRDDGIRQRRCRNRRWLRREGWYPQLRGGR